MSPDSEFRYGFFEGSRDTGRVVLYVVAFLSLVLLASIIFASIKTSHPATTIHPCALVLDRSGQQKCR